MPPPLAYDYTEYIQTNNSNILTQTNSRGYIFFIISNSPELLYHIILTVIDYHVDPSRAKQSIYIPGTNATLKAAKNSAFRVLGTLHYKPEDLGELADLFNKQDEAAKQIIAQVISGDLQ
ncbi:hypothetical protein DER44DRAFT_857387 [Fusarium oxysporum]|nr:hypothetical protein DER44DRAFT_857387 [Fusarium oxysporum]